MNEDSILTYVNGVITGAGALVAIMSLIFMQLLGKYEGVLGFTTAELRAGIILGALVSAAALGYEFYRKKQGKTGARISEERGAQVGTAGDSPS